MPVPWDKNKRFVMPSPGVTTAEIVGNSGQREWLGERWQFEDERQERAAVYAEFGDALDRAGCAGSPVLRIYGAERLSDMATRRVPGGSVLWNTEGFPFYLPAARCLSALLVVEEHPEVRGAVRSALGQLVEFGRQGEQLLLYSLISVLTDANRAALRPFRDTLGRYLAKYGVEEIALPPLAGVLTFTPHTEAVLRCLNSLAETRECQIMRDQQSAMRMAQAKFGEPSSNPNNSLVDNLLQHANRLIDTRDALALALRELLAPPLGIDTSEPEFNRWRNVRRLLLAGTFLTGAMLSGVSLPGATLAGAHLEGANLEGTNLVAADMKDAHLTGAELYGALFDGNPLPHADLRGADWWRASETSWRGAGGEAMRRWLEQHHPAPVAPLPLTDDEEATPAEAPARATTRPNRKSAAPQAPPPVEVATPTVQSAAEKIAELKRKAATRTTPSEPARADPRKKEAPVPAATKSNGRNVLGYASGKVVMRDKGLPNEADVIGENDLLAIADLMTDSDDPNKTNVAARDRGLPGDEAFTDDDLMNITDLMTEKS